MSRHINAMIATAAFCFVATASADADAAWRRFSAAGCRASNFAPNNANIEMLRFNSTRGYYHADITRTTMFQCPLKEDSVLWADLVTNMSVHLTSVPNSTPGQPSIVFAPCIVRDAIGGACGAIVEVFGNGAHTVNLTNMHPFSATGFGESYQGAYTFLSVVFSPSTVGYNSFRGFSLGT